jgi:predicted ABC-type sugar transport system permease subunit
MESSAQQKMQDTYKAATGTGWTVFAAIMFLISGVFHVVDGIAALAKSDYLANTQLFANIEFWGVVWLIIGGLALFTGYGLLTGSEVARLIGVGLASLSIITQLMFINANVWWALVVIAIDFMILYALIVKAESAQPAG